MIVIDVVYSIAIFGATAVLAAVSVGWLLRALFIGVIWISHNINRRIK